MLKYVEYKMCLNARESNNNNLINITTDFMILTLINIDK